ncbi:hypothetical protein TanjilG_13895 [Lupinus angustifolius]|uniref:Protein kinase domain-containing protein n=1 Tax=Lupinus angustifolius TaxID=3871 RepID=A0A1J7HQ38_LUPAN|nr:hypothetical protein TanjilG_13895 [Lupinus angustifolius]
MVQSSIENGGSGGRTVVVGVRIDSPSRELLTWAMFKIAQPGDVVLALHVLGNNGIELDHKNGLLDSIHRRLSKSAKVLNDEGNGQIFSDHSLAKIFLDSTENKSCSICGPTSAPDSSCLENAEDSSTDGDNQNSLAIVPVQTNDSVSRARTLHCRELPELKPGWPLLHRTILNRRHSTERSLLHQISVVQWAMQLPCRNLSYSTDQDLKTNNYDGSQDQSLALDSKTGALVPVDTKIGTAFSPERNSRSIPKELEGLHDRYASSCRLFEYQELVSATSNFLPENLIGKGGSSQVYRGCLPDGKELAVKILKPSEDVLEEFVLEIEIITTLHHKNIISLIGFCFEDANLLLVYDFLSRGSLEENLHGNKKNPLVFGWNERYKVAMGVAEALEYLHNNDGQPVIHRDVKSSNVLLSEDFEPQLSDFGLARWASTSSSHITCTDVAGTFGYLAPEYFMYGKVNDKIDVYAFGVVLLELLSGRKPISGDFPKGQESLVMWASPILNSGKVSQLLDPGLGDNYDHEEMERMVLAATLSIRRAPRARPQINIISKLLQGDADVIKWARLEVSALVAPEMLDDETCPASNLQSHLNLALLDVEDDSLSMCSIDQNVSLEDYLRGRWSRSSSFD